MAKVGVLVNSCLAAGLLVSVVRGACEVNSRFWCQDEETARNCEVYDQCLEHVWHKNDLKFKSFHEWSTRNNDHNDQEDGFVVDAPLVSLGVYYEQLCGACQCFVKQQVYPTFLKIGQIMNITLVPYGSAKEKKVGDHWEFTCPHGPDECVGNIIEACTMDIMQNMSVYLPFLTCVQWGDPGTNATTIARHCAKNSTIPVPIDEILECSTSKRGNDLEHKMALETPPHRGAPYITLNGKHSFREQYEAMMHLQKLICKTYTGTKPKACSEEPEPQTCFAW